MDLAVRIDALSTLLMEFGKIDDVAHLLRNRIELVEMRSLRMAAKTDIYLAALRSIKSAPHGLLPVIADKAVVLYNRLLLFREFYLLCERRARGEQSGHRTRDNRSRFQRGVPFGHFIHSPC